jgi:hypothetical protein
VRGRARLGIELAHPADVRVHDAAGRLVYSATLAAGRQDWTWELCDGAGRRVPAGVYRFVLTSRIDGSTIYTGRILAVR